MVDFFTRRRLLFLLIALLSVSVSVLFLRHLLPNSRRTISSSINMKRKSFVSDCYRTEPTDQITLCQKCTDFEQQFEIDACQPTGYKETVLCSTSNIQTSRPCPIPPDVQRKQFWLFEGLMLVIGIFAVANVHSRQKALDKQMMEKIRRQIGEMEH